MMEILFRSIAHAGGVPVPPGQRIFEPAPAPPSARRRHRLVAWLLTSLGRGLMALGRTAKEAGEGLQAQRLPGAPC